MKNKFLYLIIIFLLGSCTNTQDAPARDKTTTPNIIIILADDLGYGDLSCQGHPLIKTPNIDRMAAEGQRWTTFYASHFACNPSRAALLTGRLPYRIHQGKATWANVPASENTMAELLRQKVYATAHIGKWHLGMEEGQHPLDQGFEYYYGLAGSNDAPIKKETGFTRTYENVKNASFDVWDISLYRQRVAIESPVQQDLLTKRYTEESIQWIHQQKDKPFFLYLAHSMPHVPIYASPGFIGHSKAGLYGDVIEELDSWVGEIMNTLEELGISENTMVVFTSDNGPWLTYYDLGGSPGPLRDGKLTAWDGGCRVPGIFWWPGTIAPAVVEDMAANVDLMATVATLSGTSLPTDRQYDSYDLSPTLLRREAGSRQVWFYYGTEDLWAARIGNFKLHLHSRETIGSEKDGWRGYGFDTVDKSRLSIYRSSL